MTVVNKKSAILFLTHVKNKNIDDQLAKLFSECSDRFDVFALCDNTEGKFNRHKRDNRYFLFDVSQMIELGYSGKSTPVAMRGPEQNDPHHRRFHFDPANVDLPVLLFFKKHPEYDHYWTIEYDVRFTGRWDAFFSSFEANDADLLGTTLTRREKVPDWHYWPSLDLAGMAVEKDRHIRGFFPIYRLSRRALAQLDRDYRTGVKGHFECLVPTLLSHAGMTVEDIGGDGEFVRPGGANRFYRNTPAQGYLGPGTFVFRPIMERPGKEPNMLWHPVKASPLWKTTLRRVRRAMRRLALPLFRKDPAILSTTAATRAVKPLGNPVARPEPGDRLN